MDSEHALRKLIRDSQAAQWDDIQCDQVSEQMRLAASDNLSVDESRQRFSAMWRHFDVCGDCAEEYELLMDLTRLDVGGGWGVPPSVPSLPSAMKGGGGGSSLWERTRDAILFAFPGFGLPSALAVRSAASLSGAALTDLEPVEIDLDNGRYKLDISVAPSEGGMAENADVVCMLIAEDEAFDFFEGARLWLYGPSDAAEWAATADDTSIAKFEEVARGQVYTLRLDWEGQQYVVTDLAIP